MLAEQSKNELIKEINEADNKPIVYLKLPIIKK